MKNQIISAFLVMMLAACAPQVMSTRSIPAADAQNTAVAEAWTNISLTQTPRLWTPFASPATGTLLPAGTTAPPSSTNSPYPVTPTFSSASTDS